MPANCLKDEQNRNCSKAWYHLLLLKVQSQAGLLPAELPKKDNVKVTGCLSPPRVSELPSAAHHLSGGR